MHCLKLLTTSLLLLSTNLFALPCPNNGNIIYNGDSYDQVIKQCGIPHATNQYIKYLVQKWTFYKPHTFDQGSTKIIVLLKNDRVVNIEVSGNTANCQSFATSNIATLQPVGTSMTALVPNAVNQQFVCGGNGNLNSSNICGSLISVGDSAQAVNASCGLPAFVEKSQNPEDKIAVTEITYKGSQPLIFVNGVLTH